MRLEILNCGDDKERTKRICICFVFVANAPDSDRNDLLSELEVMKKLKPHPHVIKLMGCVTESGKGSLMRHHYMAN